MRVLLADESSTIKKAIQMVLAEYGVEIKTVPTGIDVLSVAQSFLPDIIIADILLNKKNGYEVGLELKNNENTKDIPIILMWSSFIQLDTQLFKDSKADASLEKPFETHTIKALVEKLVPKLRTFPLKGFLNHAPLPDFEESDTFIKQKNNFNTLTKPESSDAPLTIEAAEATAHHAFIIDDKTENTKTWNPSETDQFVVETENFGDFEEVKAINSLNEKPVNLQKEINQQIQSYLQDSPVTLHKAKSTLQQQKTYSSFDEQLMKEEIRQITERICWQVIPEVTEKVVREELKKLLEGLEKNI